MAMAIVDDYAAIAAELRRLRAERGTETAPPQDQPTVRPLPGSWHPMRATSTGEALYRRLLSQRRRAARIDYPTKRWCLNLSPRSKMAVQQGRPTDGAFNPLPNQRIRMH